MKVLGKTLRVIFFALLGLLLLLSLWQIAARAFFKQPLPDLFGYSYLAVLSGSMEPAISAGDLIVTHRQENYLPGDIITFAEGGAFTTHRITAVGAEGFQTQGDANNTPDRDAVISAQVVGRVVLALPAVGSALIWLRSPAGIGCILLAGLLMLFSGRNKQEEKRGAG